MRARSSIQSIIICSRKFNDNQDERAQNSRSCLYLFIRWIKNGTRLQRYLFIRSEKNELSPQDRKRARPQDFIVRSITFLYSRMYTINSVTPKFLAPSIPRWRTTAELLCGHSAIIIFSNILVSSTCGKSYHEHSQQNHAPSALRLQHDIREC